MATFYVLPPRSLLGERLARQLQTELPRLRAAPEWWQKLADAVIESLATMPSAFVIPKDELPCDEELVQALKDGFGAEPGDDVIEVRAQADRLSMCQSVVM